MPQLRSLTGEEALALQPGLAEARPGQEAGRRRSWDSGPAAEAEAVLALLEEVQLDRHLGLAQGEREEEAVLGRDARVGVGVGEERRRGLRPSPGSRWRG